MSRINFFIKSIIILCLGTGVVSCNSTKNKQSVKAKHPNIIYILADDMGYGDLGCYGQQVIKTPHIDQMAAEGIRFTQHYAGTSVCAPSRASLMTGRDNGHSRVRGNYETGRFGFGGELELRPQDTTVAEVLKRAGYHTALIGKWGLGMNGTTGEPNKKGFDYSYGFLNQAYAHNQFPDYLFKNGKKVSIPANANGKLGYFTNDIFTDDAVRYINEQKKSGGPFFLFLSYVTPHAEMLVPEDSIFNQFKGKFKEVPYQESLKGGGNGKDSFGVYRSQQYPAAAYAAMITHMDNDVNKVLKLVKQLGLDSNTVVMFSSDNGPHKEGGYDPKYFKSSGPFRGGKRDLYEGGIREPLIVRWPGMVKPGTVTNQLSAFWDMMPTFADIARASMKNVTTEGYSLLPTLLDKAGQKQHPYFYWEFHENKYSDQAVRKGNWKAVRHDPDKPLELYDLNTDVAEQHDVAAQHSEIVKEMEQLMISARVDNPYFPIKRSGAKK